MWRPKTLRTRFALWVAALLLAMLLAFGGYVYLALARGLAASIDDSLEISAAQAIAAVSIEDNHIDFEDAIPSDALTQLRERGSTIRVLDLDGQIQEAVGRYGQLPVVPAQVAAARQRQALFATVPAPGEEAGVRFYTAPIIADGQMLGIIQIGQSLGDTQEILERLARTLFVGIPLLIGIAALSSYVLTRRALMPIDQMTRTARRISAEDLQARLALPATDDEVGRLAATFDEMITRLQASFQRERRFTSDASHELRTPLAAMEVILGVIRAERRTPEDYEQALDDLADETHRLRALTETLLRLARGANASASAFEPIDLALLVSDVAEAMRPIADAKGLRLTYTLPPDLNVIGDNDSLIRLFVNLVENAIKYSEHGSITVCGEVRPDSVQVRVTDTGMGIAAEQLPHVFERFYRADTAHTTSGAGLGLALVYEIAHAHGGTITVQSQVGTGSTFAVTFPRTNNQALPGFPIS